MNPPFTTKQFFEVFEYYNLAVYPAQLIILGLGILGVVFLHVKRPVKNFYIGVFLGGLWLWIGILYHLTFFTAINQAAYGFGGAFVLQGLFFLYEALIKKRLAFAVKNRLIHYLGYFFILFGLLIYPLISYAWEGSWERTIALGLPCPTTILTFGFLMLSVEKFPRYLLIIPFVWALIGTGAAINFGVHQDYVMLAAALIASAYLIRRKRTNNNETTE